MDIITLLYSVGIATGFCTKLRVMHLIGLSEISFLVIVLMAIFREKFASLYQHSNIKNDMFIMFFIPIIIIFVNPLMTLLNYKFLHLCCLYPHYIPGYIMAFLIFLATLLYLNNNKINLRKISIFSAIIFIALNIIVTLCGKNYYMWNIYRFDSFAINPNQVAIYGFFMIFLLWQDINLKKANFINNITLTTIIIFIVYFTKSDAFYLAVFLAFVSCVILFLLTYNKTTFIITIFFFVIAIALSLQHLDFLVELWKKADDGTFNRLYLTVNGIKALSYSPFAGLGSGSFSGIVKPFSGSEVHNTFLDFSVRFGVVFATYIYYIIVKYIVYTIKNRQIYRSGVGIGLLSLSLFHFIGRHFTFWVILAIMYYIFSHNKQLQ
ncbi:hypothetical protein [Hippea jasoniae]|uniref:hypothetical protein n=1 Tax=Hippea jasoniae TaxID=944479 RepID=UPI0005542060|nr:hypothetical protein [Hippea jasoniae]